MFHPAVLKTLAPLMLIGAAAAFAPAIASAAYSDSPNSVIATKVVRFNDLKLDQSGDVAALYARIRHAAAQVCSSGPGSATQRDCFEKAIATAVARVNNPSLTAYHEHRAGGVTRAGA
jgi:UrcA family protein